MPTVFQKFKYHILLHSIIFIWGFTGIIGKLVSLEPEILVWYRVLIAFFGLFFAFIFLKKSFVLPEKNQLWKILGVGILVCLHWITFYTSIDLSTASLGILCLSTTTLHVSWLEPLVMKKKFSWLEFSFGLIVIFGIYYVSEDFTPKEYTALFYGLSSALFAALFSVFNAQLAVKTSSPQLSIYEMFSAVFFLSLFLLFKGSFTAEKLTLHDSDLYWLLFLGLFCTSFAFLATIEVVKKLGAFTVSLAINLEPIYTIILAVVILQENEYLNSKFYTGAAIIILVVVANAVLKSYMRKSKKRKEELSLRKFH